MKSVCISQTVTRTCMSTQSVEKRQVSLGHAPVCPAVHISPEPPVRKCDPRPLWLDNV